MKVEGEIGIVGSWGSTTGIEHECEFPTRDCE